MEEQQEQENNVMPDLWGDSPVDTFEQEQEPEQESDIEPDAPEEPSEPEVPEPVIQEKIVEKVVEKPLEFKDDYSRQIYEALSEGKDDIIKSYLDEKYKDYDTMADLDVVREKLKKENPEWSTKDIDSELRFKYGKHFEMKDLSRFEEDGDTDSPEYKEALRFNEEVEKNLLLLERDSRDSRIWLNGKKQSIELPKITQDAPVEQPKQLTAEEIQQINERWNQTVEAEMPKLSDLSWSVGGEEVSFKTTEKEKQEFKEFMKTFNDAEYLTARGWYNDKGEANILKIAEDVRKLESIDKIVASVATQVKTSAKKEVVSEIKQIDLNKSKTQSASVEGNLGDALWG